MYINRQSDGRSEEKISLLSNFNGYCTVISHDAIITPGRVKGFLLVAFFHLKPSPAYWLSGCIELLRNAHIAAPTMGVEPYQK